MFPMLTFYIFIIILSIPISQPQILNYMDDVDKSDFVPRVVNGWPANLGDVPYQLAFKSKRSRFSRKYHTFCGGTIIGQTKVLSAAHCFQTKTSGCEVCINQGKVKRKVLARTMAVAGNLQNTGIFSSVDSLQNGQWRGLKSMFIPINYKFPKNDIAVGYTSTPFIFNSNVNYIPYATKYRDYAGKCLVSGYGRISKWKSSDRLLLGHLVLHSQSWCSRLHRTNMRKFICTSSTISDVQKGDSGGPLVCLGTTDPAETSTGLLVGVVSGHRSYAGSFFTRVSTFHSFILKGRARDLSGSGVMIFICLLYGGILLFLFCFIDSFHVLLFLQAVYS